MRNAVLAAAALLCTTFVIARADDAANKPTTAPAADALSFTVNDIDGHSVDLGQYRGKVVLIVNVASKCGFTPQYEGLEKLYKAHKDAGLVVLGFPANDFKGQEPGTNEEIKTFCTTKYDVTFPMMAKLSVKGDEKAPLFKYLTEKETVGDKAAEVGWNFNKFLIGRDGKLIEHYMSKTKPDDEAFVKAIETALAAK